MSIGFPDIANGIWYRTSWQESREYRWDFTNLGTGALEFFRITNTLTAFRDLASSSCDSTNLSITATVIPDIRFGGTTSLDANSGASARNDSNTFSDNNNGTTRQEGTWTIISADWIAITSTVV